MTVCSGSGCVPLQVGQRTTFSPDRRYRYVLRRPLEGLIYEPIYANLFRPKAEGTCLFIMLNPSTADETTNDPTVRRTIGFATDWGYANLVVCNIFGYRGTDPKELGGIFDPVGPVNDDYIVRSARDSNIIIAAWGEEVLEMLAERDVSVHHLGLTKGGHPRHPLYLPKTTKPGAF